jgi:hypothetical protein
VTGYENRRHPAEITDARLREHCKKWEGRLSDKEREAISTVRSALYRIAVEDEGEAQAAQETRL